MSAFLCTPEHIQAITAYGVFAKAPYCIPGDQIASELARENIASVAYRYPGKTAEGAAKVFFPDDKELNSDQDYITACARPWMPGTSEHVPILPPIKVIKLVDSLDYQSCEHPQWERSNACKWLNQIRSAAIHRLEGWENAPWTI